MSTTLHPDKPGRHPSERASLTVTVWRSHASEPLSGSALAGIVVCATPRTCPTAHAPIRCRRSRSGVPTSGPATTRGRMTSGILTRPTVRTSSRLDRSTPRRRRSPAPATTVTPYPAEAQHSNWPCPNHRPNESACTRRPRGTSTLRGHCFDDVIDADMVRNAERIHVFAVPSGTPMITATCLYV